ncbi:alpha-(1-_3)-arabinofuranosyltransferase [Nocardia arthritidis]|uniref:alpha-(1->3)-arabinofuranosyltransferase n=1 Tax=Nocardia arthritidis TaxID=228602 RepID=UPI003D1606A5
MNSAPSDATAPLGRRWFAGTVAAAFLLTFLQAPGRTVADTKYDLAQNPLGFLDRAAHLWSSQAPMGQVQNQAYGYFFPHGAFFSAGHLIGIPAWVTQRIWWALLLLAGFWGIIRLCELLGIGTRGSRVIAAITFALSPRVLTTLGSISSETLPMMLAPWVLLAPAALGVAMRGRRSGTGADDIGSADSAVAQRAARSIDVPTDRRWIRGAGRNRFASVPADRRWLRGLARGMGDGARRFGGAESAAGSALALALMGSVNAVATVAAFLPAALWWGSFRPDRRWLRFTAAWIPLLVLATFWWAVPLLLLGKVSPPFLDYIESSGVTTQWASLAEVLRGTDSWTPFVSPERIAGAVLVTQPAAVLATGLLAAAGMAGLAMRSMPNRGRLALILCVGLVGICAGYAGQLGGPFAESVRIFLDSGGAPLRNVHKLEPLIRIPLVLGLAHLLARVPLPASVPMPVWRSAFAHPERNRSVAVAGLILTALALSTSLAWTGKLAPRGAYDRVPAYWQQTADWLAHNASDTRALVVPGAPFGSQIWGLTRDEPLQALASTPWAIRDAVPLNPPGTIRAMDSVQRLIADGRPSAGLARTLIDQGIGIVVLRNDLDPETSRSTRPMPAHQAIEGSPGLTKVAEFGAPVESTAIARDLVVDGDLRPTYPAIEIYRVDTRTPGTPIRIRGGTGAPGSFPGAYTVPLTAAGVVQGGPEVLERLNRDGAPAPVTGLETSSATSALDGKAPWVLASDAERAGVPLRSVLVTDTPMNREADFGQVDNHNSALRAPSDPRRTHNLVPDYLVPGAELVQGEWSGATITASSSAADATQIGGSAPGSSTAAVVDGDPSTAWISNGAERALGQWLQLDLDKPIGSGLLTLTTSAAAIGDPVRWVEVATENGTVSAQIPKPGEPVKISLAPGRTRWVRITAAHTEGGTRGGQFGISELALDDYTNRAAPVHVDIRHRTVLPPTPPGVRVDGWDLGQEFPGRSACFDAPDRVRCHKGLALAPEEPNTFERTLSVPEPMTVAPELTVRTRQGPALAALLTDHDRPVARGQADVGDLRGSAFAATDGDPRTSWTAPEDSVRRITGGKPTLTIELPAPALVTGLELTPSKGGLPAEPATVAVNLGDGPQVRELDGKRGEASRISLHPKVTDRIEVSLLDWHPVLDRTALGFVLTQPAGLAEVSVIGPDYPAPASPDRLITIPCGAGPVIALGGRTLHTTVTATATQLRSGAPVPARVCTDYDGAQADSNATFDIPQGRADVTVAPTEMFSVDRLRLTRAASDPSTAASSVSGSSSSSGGSLGTVAVGESAGTPDSQAAVAPSGLVAPAGTQLLVLPLSTNVGWQAHTADGRTLSPIVVNGWQQAWLLPADAVGPITVSFPIDRWYRLSIFGGLFLLIPLIVLAIPRRRPFRLRWNRFRSQAADHRPIETAEVSRQRPAPGSRSDITNSSGSGAMQHVSSSPGEQVRSGVGYSDIAPEPSGIVDDGSSRRDADALADGSGLSLTSDHDGSTTNHVATQDNSTSRTWGTRITGAIALVAAAMLISGPVGAGLAVAGIAAAHFLPRYAPKALVILAGVGTAMSAAALSTGPWRFPNGYMGGSLWAQFPALVAVIALGIAALPSRRTIE